MSAQPGILSAKPAGHDECSGLVLGQQQLCSNPSGHSGRCGLALAALKWGGRPLAAAVALPVALPLVLLVLTAALLTLITSSKYCSVRSFGLGRCAEDNLQPRQDMADPQQWPREESFHRLQADPGLALREPQLLSEFEAAPWLLPEKAAKLLPYMGVHDLDRLLALRAAPAAGHASAVALLAYNRPYSVMAQNCVYSLAKLGGANNYLLFTWTAPDLAACTRLHLPCADVSGMLPEALDGRGDSQFGTHDFNIIQWLKARVTLRGLQAGHVTLLSDADVAYMAKPVWPSFTHLLNLSSADGVFQGTGGTSHTLNTGTYVILPTPGGIEAIRRWAGLATGKFSEQVGLGMIRGKAYLDCTTPAECQAVRKTMKPGGPPALFQHFPSAQAVASGKGNCALADPAFAGRINPCDWFVLFLHPVCTGGRGAKPLALERQGMWLIDDGSPVQRAGCLPWNASAPANATDTVPVPACQPRRWRQPGAEDRLYRCPANVLALVPPQDPPYMQG